MAISVMTLYISTSPLYGAIGSLRSLSTADGLSDLLVNTLYKDSTGYMWFGTEMALDRYDGNRIRSYRFPDGEGGSQLRVNAIAELRRGEIFVGNHQGLYVLSPGSDALTRVFPERINFPVRTLADDGKHTLYIGTRQGLFTYDVIKKSLNHMLLHSDILSEANEITGMWINPGADLWISTLHTLHFLDFTTGKTESYPFPVSGSISMMTGNDRLIFLGTHGSGVVPFDISGHTFLPPIELGNNIITSLCADGSGNIYVSTDGEGIYRYSLPEQSVTAHLTTSPSSPLPIRSNSVYSMTTDDNGLLWIGYYQNGVDYTPHYNDIFTTYVMPGAIDTHQHAVRAVAIADGYKVIGTRDGLFLVNESTGTSRRFVKPEIASNIIFCITHVAPTYYIGTYNGGMYTLDPTTATIAPFTLGEDATTSTISVFAIVADPHGDLWIGASDGLHRLHDGREVARYTSLNSQLPDGNVYEIFFDSTGRGWICTENGMAIWDGSSLRTGHFPNGFVNGMKIRDIIEDREHNLYFAPDRGEIFKSNLELTEFGFIHSGVKDPVTMTTFMIEDRDGWIWFGTDKGLTRHDKRNHFHQFNNADGIPHPVFTLCPPVMDSNGDIYMGNSQGLIRLDYRKFKSAERHMHDDITVTDILTNGHSVMTRLDSDQRGRRTITLGDHENDLMVSVANFRYIPSTSHEVEYQLDGYEKEWRKTDGTQPIHYYDISPGSYMLRMRVPGDPSTESVLWIEKRAGLNWPLLTGIAVILITTVCILVLLRLRRRHREELRWIEKQASAPVAVQPASDATTAMKSKARYSTTSLTDEECKRLIKVLDNVMKTQRPYTDPDLKSAGLAAMAGTTSHALSYLFNQYMQKSYYDYVNTYRVAEFKRLVKEGDIGKYTLTAMAQKCGFSSRASFFRHFKNVTGITPAEYIKQNE